MPVVARLAPRTICAAALAAAALAAWSPSALAAVEVTVEPPDGGIPVTVSTDEIDGQVDETYTVRQASGQSQTVVVKDGVSILQLLESVDANFGYVSLSIPRDSGTPLTLTREQVEDDPPPVIYTDENGVSWLLGAGSGGVVDAADHLRLGDRLTLTQAERGTLDVTVTPIRKRIDPGDTVTFRAAVLNAPAGATYTFDWNFRDGGREIGPESRVSHTFHKRGEYRVLVTASIDGTSRSDSAPVAVITVGKPIKSKKNRTGGGSNTAAGAPDSGSSDGANGAGESSSAPPPPAASAPPPPAPSKPKAPKPEVQSEPIGGPLIEGNLLADASASPERSILRSAARAARDGTLRAKRTSSADPTGGGTDEAALGIASVLLLVGLGAGLELRRTSRPRLL